MPYALSGITALTAAHFWDTATPNLAGSAPNQYYLTDAFARVVVLTADTSLIVEAVGRATGAYSEVSIWVNGVYNQTLTFAFSGGSGTKSQQTATLPAGTKTVELVSDSQSITAVSATSYDITPAPSTVASRCVEWGDSIARGYYATPFGASHLPTGIRQSRRFVGCTSISNPGDELFNYRAAIPALVTFILARFADCAAGTRVLFIEMVTNDYGLDHWGESSWAPVYASLLDQLHAADSGLQIVCNKGFLRGSTGAQAVHGSTFADFQNGVVSMVAARSSFCRLLDVTTLGGGDLVDGLHPNNGGHDKIAAAFVGMFALPIVPSGLVLSAASSTSVNVSWTDNATDETVYHVYYSSAGIKPGSPQVTLAANSTTTTVAGLTSGLTYTFWVEAYNANGASAAITGSILLPPTGGPFFQMQGLDTATQELVPWVVSGAPDWAGALSPVPVTDIVLSVRGRTHS